MVFELPEWDPGAALTELHGLARTEALKASLAAVQSHVVLWQENDDDKVAKAVALIGPEAASSLLLLTRCVIADSGQGEAMFLGGTEPVAGDVLAPALTQWTAVQRTLYEDAVKRPITRVDALQFVQRFRRSLNEILRLAVPRLLYWKSRASEARVKSAADDPTA